MQAEIITAAEYRNGISNLVVEYLGIPWARTHYLKPYSHLNSIPDEALPELYARAQEDACAVIDEHERKEAAKARQARKVEMPGWPRSMGAELAASYVGLSVSAIHRLRRAGDFPIPVVLTPGRLAWYLEQLDAWLDVRAGFGRRSTGNILDDLPDA